MTDHDPLTVECPDCAVPAGVPCTVSTSDVATHAGRRRLVDLRNLDHGICALCGKPMVRGSIEDAPIDAWHPDATDATACPDLGDPATDWERYATNVNLGLTAGHPGIEHFVASPIDTSPASLDAAPLPGTACADHVGGADTEGRSATGAGEAPLLCPECAQGKHPNCALQALDPATDELVACACNDDAHRTQGDA